MGVLIVVLLIVPFLLFCCLRSSKKGKAKKPVHNNASGNFSAESGAPTQVNLTVQYTVRDVRIYQKTPGILPAFSREFFGEYVSPSGGFVNYAHYLIGGKAKDTGIKRSREFDAKSASSAIAQAEKFGIIDPYLIEVLPNRPPSLNQLAFAKDLGAVLPNGACFHDVSAIISRIYDNDERAVDGSLAKCAAQYDFDLSLYSGTKAIMEMVSNLPADRRKQFSHDLASTRARKTTCPGKIEQPYISADIGTSAKGEAITAKMYPILRPIPKDPRFYNIGSNLFHKSRECFHFSDRDDWDAVTEQEAIHLGLAQCSSCFKPIVFSYGNVRVYHSTTWCSTAKSACQQLFEDEAVAKGMRKCKRCQERDTEGLKSYYGSTRCLNAYNTK